MVGTTCGTPADLDTRPFQVVPSRHVQDDVYSGIPLQEYHIQLHEFVPIDVQGKDRTMYTSAVSQLFRNYAKLVTKNKLVVQNGTIAVRGHFTRKEAIRRLGKLCQSKLMKLHERQCYVLMNNKNLMDFTKETGAFAICKPKQEMLLILGPVDRLKAAVKYIQTHYSEITHDAQRGDRRVMKISVLARQYILDNRQSLVEKGHIWIDRASEENGTQDLHIVGYPKDFDFDKAEKNIRDAETEYLETQHSAGQKLPPGVVVLVGDKVQIKKHRDSSKLLIAEDLPQEQKEQCAVEPPQPVKTASTVDFPYLTNPLKYSTTVFSKFRDPNNIWATNPFDASSAVSNSSTMFAYHSSASSTGVPEDTELPPEMSAPWMNDSPEEIPPQPTPSALLQQLQSVANAPLSSSERSLLKDICHAAGILKKDAVSSGSAGKPPSHPEMIKVLVHYSNPARGDDPLEGNHTLRLLPSRPFSAHKEEICQKLSVDPSDHSFEQYDGDFGVNVRIADDDVLQSFSRLEMKRIVP
eukprot:TRINITY_DN20200_c0_g1_i1.p1 TRINITY_DN20200_c0_g1~~TRINITY_DN20200_c0_g1_i1.p1  ORF type:complete len:523 (+),score=123.25 TRINITY_DN20200_c0_g1_i1:142-1710(+)